MINSELWFSGLVLAVGLERLLELLVARRNRRWALTAGGIEYGAAHYPLIVLVQTGLLLGCLAEVWFRRPEFVGGLGWTMLALVLAAQALRWWCIATLGRRWNTRIIVLPGRELIRSGPYRLLHHPNYVAVVVEGLALPLVHSAWITAVAFTVLNGAALAIRIRAENRALALGPSSAP